MRRLAFEDVVPDAGLFLDLVRRRVVAPEVPPLDIAVRAAARRTLDRARLVDAIERGVAGLGGPGAEPTLRAAQRLRADGVVAVVAGQQPVLFGGPHLVTSKILAAVALARRIGEGGVPAVPVYWSATEDHDQAEAASVTVASRDGALVPLAAAMPGDRRMLSRVAVPAEAAALHARLAALLPDGPGRDAALRMWAPRSDDGSWGAWITRGLMETFARFGVVVVEPHWLREAAAFVAERDVAAPGAIVAAVTAAEERLAVAHGHARPLGLRGPHVCFVVGRDGSRHRATTEGLAAAVRRGPESVSWDVAGRVLAQAAALPAAAQICGPAELGYVSAASAAHALLGLPVPHAAARPGVTFAWGPETVGGAPQERTLSILSFVAERGEAMLDRMADVFAFPGTEHVVLSAEDLS